MQTLFSHFFLFVLIVIPLSANAQIRGPKGVPKPDKEWIEDIRIDQRLGDSIPLGLTFKNEIGEVVNLGQYMGDKPVILSLVYYECPTLCNQVLNSTLRALNVLTFDIGTEFEVVTVSIDPNETPSLAAAKKAEYLKSYRGDNAALGWHFLTGEQDQIAELAEAVGFNYRYDEASEQYLHASAIMILTPDGTLARYFYGIDYPPRDLRWGLVEAANGTIGNPIDQLLLLCYSYDPMTGKYGLIIRNSLRIAGIATVIVLGTFIFVMLRRERRDQPLSLN